MNGINEILIFLVIFLAGGIIGFVIYHITLGRKKAGVQQQELDQTKADLEHYKSQVNDHFTSSAELMGQVATSYQALYTHMAGQSKTLLGDTEVPPFPLLKTPEDIVRLDSSELVPDGSETASDSSETAPDNSETKSDNSETKSDNSETATDSSETKSDKGETNSDSSETNSDNSETVSDSIEKASDSSEALSDSIETASDDSKTVSDDTETVSDASEKESSKQPHSKN